MSSSDGDLVIALFFVIAIAVLVRRHWARPHLDEAIAIRRSQTNGEPYEPLTSDRARRHHRPWPPGLDRMTWPLMPFALLADRRTWLNDLRSDLAEAGGMSLRVLILVSHLCSAPSRISVVWSGRCRRLLRLLPR